MAQSAGIPLPAILIAIGIISVLLLIAFAIAGGALVGRGPAQRRVAALVGRVNPHEDEDQDRKINRRAQTRRRQGSGDQLAKRLLPNPEVLRRRIMRTGFEVSLGKYALGCLGIGIVAGAVSYYYLGIPLAAPLIGLTIGLGLPHLIVKFLIGRRLHRFNMGFPEAIDLIVRGLKSGLPVTDSFNVIAKESAEPVRSEFRRVVEYLSLGKTMDEALWMMADRIGTPEFNFFVVAMSVQRETGGNLAETLENLGDILRKRKQTKLKIKALSAEARASALIIGVLPFIMFGIIYSINPYYIDDLWKDDRGIVLLVIGLLWLFSGFGVMAKMVRFEV